MREIDYKELYEQVKWERDIAIEQLTELGYSLGEKIKIGKWVKAVGDWCTPGGDPVWECSECGKGRHVYGVEASTYQHDVADGQWVACPNCGAKMTKDEKF